MTQPLTPAESRRVLQVRRTIEILESDVGSKFYGLENVTKSGPRLWSIAPCPPNKALDEIKGTGNPAPEHILRKWCNKKRAWRSIDLRTTRRIWYTDSDGIKREINFS